MTLVSSLLAPHLQVVAREAAAARSSSRGLYAPQPLPNSALWRTGSIREAADAIF